MDKWTSLLGAFLLVVSISALPAQPALDIQGNRGCRGLMPENSMPGFLKAVELGVSTLGLDLVVSMDGQLVVSHQPWISPMLCNHSDGKAVTKSESKRLNIYQMKYDEIQNFDCGSRSDPDFPHQHSIPTVKPTLKMVVRSVQRFASDNKYIQPRFSLELISAPSHYDTYIPRPDVFVELVVNEIRRLGIEESTTVQSFDINILEALHKTDQKKFQIAYLIGKGKNAKKNLQKLNFKPDIYSPHISLVNEQLIKELHLSGIKIIPWPVNTKELMDRLETWGADGIITDYPDVMRQ